MPSQRLIHPQALDRALAGAATIVAGQASLAAVRAWPLGTNGFIVLLRDEDGGRWGAAAFGDEDPPDYVLAARERGDVWPLGASGGFVWRHASDPALALRRALAPSAPRVLRASGQPGCTTGLVEVLSYKPLQRSVLRFARATKPALITKLYGGRRDELAALAHADLRSLPSPPDASFRVLHPVSRVHEWRALLWPEAAGTTLHAQLATPEASRLTAIAGSALACLHAADAAWTRSHRRDDELAGIGRWTWLAGRVWPEWQEALHRTLEGLRQWSASLGEGPLLPSHRDFHDKQLLVDLTGAAILDLDLACRAEPELDIGNLLAHLRLRVLQGRLHAQSPVAYNFLDAYVRTNDAVELERIAFYQSCASLRLACVYALRPRWAALVPRLVAEARNGAAGHDTKEEST